MKPQFFLSLALILIALVAPAAALDSTQQTVNVSVVSQKDAVYPGDCNKYTATVNNLFGEQRVDLSIVGDRLSWISLTSSYVDYNLRGSKDVLFYLCPTIGSAAGTYNFVLSARSRENNYTYDAAVPVYVLERPYLEIRDIVFSKDVYKIGESAEVTVNVKNLGDADAKNTHLILEISGANAPDKIRTDVPTVEVGKGKPVTEKIEFDRFLSHGEYTVTARIVDDIGDNLTPPKIGKITVEEKSELQQETTSKNSMLSKIVTLRGSNNGNKADTIELKSSGTGYLVLYSFETLPAKIEYSGGKKVFTWTCMLAPAESCIVKYQVDYWLLIVAIAAIFGIVYVVYNVSQQPHIQKRIMKKDKEHAVHITIRNKSRNVLQNIQVTDVVPDVVSIVSGSLSPAIKPQVRGKRGGVELIWTFAKLAPGEERVITYRIKPVVMVLGRIHLPNARIHATDAGGKRYEAKTSVVVE